MNPHVTGAARQRRTFSLWVLCAFAVIVGAVAGYGAVFFRALIGLIHNLFFLGQFAIAYDSSVFTPPSPWGPFVILVPVLGGLAVVFLVKTFAPEAKGHGVPEVMDAIYYNEGRIRPIVAVIKSLASAISIGTGAAVGREGPIIQIGASMGSTIGQITNMAPWQRITLVAAGAGAGIAATFNTPLGAVMFAVELMMPEISTRTFLPVVIATGTATYIGRLYFGLDPAFHALTATMHLHVISLTTLAAFIVLGLLVGVGAFLFVRLLTAMELFFEGPFWKDHPYLSHAFGMGVLGCVMYALLVWKGHYFIEGVGYSTIQSILDGNMDDLMLLLALLFFAKLLATTLSLGSGASGGVFSPSMFMGATLGAAFGSLVIPFIPNPGFTIADFAMVGMASMVGASTGAAVMAILMIFEMTLNYNLIIPMILAVTLAVGIRRVLSYENIYTIKLAWRGLHIPKDRHSNMFLVRHAQEVMTKNFVTMPASTHIQDAIMELRGSNAEYIVVADGRRVAGTIPVSEMLVALDGVRMVGTLNDFVDHRFILARPKDSMFHLFGRFSRGYAPRALVVEGAGVPHVENVVGIISRHHIADAVLENFSAYVFEPRSRRRIFGMLRHFTRRR